MKIEFIAAARRDLEEILEYLASHNPALVERVEDRIHAILALLRHAPESARVVMQRPGVRVVPLIHYPYRMYYRVTMNVIEVIHIRHTSRRPWEDEP
jgi:plasmid stabilization system protein ParE